MQDILCKMTVKNKYIYIIIYFITSLKKSYLIMHIKDQKIKPQKVKPLIMSWQFEVNKENG